MKIHVQVFIWSYSLVFLGRIAESCGINFLRNHQTFFSNFTFPESIYNGSVFLQHWQCIVPKLFILVIIMAVDWYFVVVLINIFLMTTNGCLIYFSIAMTMAAYRRESLLGRGLQFQRESPWLAWQQAGGRAGLALSRAIAKSFPCWRPHTES